ncbi:hypothetical protein BG000_007478, partial [Podila horticola]
TEDLPDGAAIYDEEIAEFMRMHPFLQSIDLMNCLHTSELTVAAIVDNCGELCDLNLSACISISSHGLQEILGKAKNLECLTVYHEDGDMDMYEPYLTAEVMRPLATTSLTLFSCDIVVYRPDAHSEGEGGGHDRL